MMNIRPYQGDPLALYDAIVLAKSDREDRRATLTRLRPRVEAQYLAYKEHLANLANLRPYGRFTREERAALDHCYESQTAPLQSMKLAVLEALPPALTKCPYCGLGEIGYVAGEDGSEGGWDHYLPRSSRPDPRQGYMELAVHPHNLIPCCATCNGHKTDHFRNGSQRRFIHVYHDTIDQSAPLLEARFDLGPGDTVRVTYHYADRPYSEFFSLFMRHCEALDLKRRYASAARAEVVNIRDRVQQYAPLLGLRVVADDLGGQADKEARRVGVSHWRPVLYRAAARSNAFLQHCLEGTQAPAASAGAEAV